jgi:hypothetical protein
MCFKYIVSYALCFANNNNNNNNFLFQDIAFFQIEQFFVN